jgi:hypothetical protein
MDPKFFRKYADLIESVEQDKVVISEAILSEGFLSNIAKKLADKLMGMLDPKTQQALAMAVKDATGGNYALTADNAMKVAAALGIDKQDAKKEAGGAVAEGEEYGLAGNWQGKLLQAIHALGALHLITNLMGSGVFDSQVANNWVAAIGLVLLMVTATFWSKEKGMVGAMGNYGNKGFEIDKGPQ